MMIVNHDQYDDALNEAHKNKQECWRIVLNINGHGTTVYVVAKNEYDAKQQAINKFHAYSIKESNRIYP